MYTCIIDDSKEEILQLKCHCYLAGARSISFFAASSLLCERGVKLKLASKSQGERERKGGKKLSLRHAGFGERKERPAWRRRVEVDLFSHLLGPKSVRSCLYLCFS